MLTDLCIYTIKHSDDLRATFDAGGRGTYTVSFRQACMNRPGLFVTLAALSVEDRDACEQRWRVAEGFVAGP